MTSASEESYSNKSMNYRNSEFVSRDYIKIDGRLMESCVKVVGSSYSEVKVISSTMLLWQLPYRIVLPKHYYHGRDRMIA